MCLKKIKWHARPHIRRSKTRKWTTDPPITAGGHLQNNQNGIFPVARATLVGGLHAVFVMRSFWPKGWWRTKSGNNYMQWDPLLMMFQMTFNIAATQGLRCTDLRAIYLISIFLKNGKFFRTLCAIDPEPRKIKDTEVVAMFNLSVEVQTLFLNEKSFFNLIATAPVNIDTKYANL